MFTVIRKSDQSRKKITENNDPIDYASKESLDTLSLDDFEGTDYYEKGKASFSRIYQVYEGAMHVIINEEEIILNKGDSIFIGKGTSFEMKGTFKALAVNKEAI